MNLKKIQSLIIMFLVSFTLVVCGNDSLTSAPVATDYSKSEYWLSLPAAADKEVDVFYLYPTAWHKVDANEPNICEIDNPSMLIGAKAAFARQATAFKTVGNIYAPYYRQADAAYCLSLPLTEQDKMIGGIPTLDAVAAFDYYIKHYSKGRPFILAGHSQGSNVLIYLLSEYMKENPQVYDRMIAAYVIGYSVTEDYLAKNSHLKFAEGPDDTGVIISYNTEAPTVVGNNPVVLPGALVINPITWSREETLAMTSEGLGSFLPDPVTRAFSRVPQYADARINKTKGVLICSTADEDALYKLSGAFGRGIYHSFDYPFYYFNIRENAANRVDSFLNKQQVSYLIDSTVFTTLQKTVLPDSIPSDAAKLLPYEISKYKENGYGTWTYGPGLDPIKRLDLMPAAYTNTSATNTANLLRFFNIWGQASQLHKKKIKGVYLKITK